jgi:hypothetical protein
VSEGFRLPVKASRGLTHGRGLYAPENWISASGRAGPAQAQPYRRHRYDKLAVRYEATVHVAAINEWLRPGSPDTP